MNAALLAAWIGTWAAAPQAAMPGGVQAFRDQTLRLIVHVSVGGSRLRIRLSNTYGDRPLAVGAARVARRTAGANVDPATDRTLTFAGKGSVEVPAGETIASDAVPLEFPALSDLAISLYLPGEVRATTSHLLALQQGYAAVGDATGRAKFPVVRRIKTWPFLTGVEVESDGPVLAAFGDSTVDGDGTTPDANHRFPDFLAARLRTPVLNQGLIGNRLLRDSPGGEVGQAFGESGLRRFERDGLGHPGVRTVVVRIGVNDLAFPGAVTPAAEALTAADLIDGFRKLAASARRRGIRIVAATIAPFEGAKLAPGFWTPEKDAVRREVNAWLLQSRDFDAVVDLDAVLRDPARPARLLPAWDSGDHLHPNDAGSAAAADAVVAIIAPVR